jgi:hypothetical protein
MILIVRHGEGRGRDRPYMQPFLDYVKGRRPRLFDCLHLHETGGALPNLDGFRAVVFWLADPLREWYRSCFEEAVMIAAEARSRRIPVVNPPEALSNAIKSVQAKLWLKAGIPTPEIRPFANLEELCEILSDGGYPLLIRPDQGHRRPETLRLCRTMGEVGSLDLQEIEYPGAVVQLVDVREGFRRADPDSILARYYHKKRALILGRVVRNDELFFSNNLVVKSGTCTFRAYADHPKWLSRIGVGPRIRAEDRPLIEADIDYWRKGIEHQELFRRAADVLGIQWLALDYADLADGGVVLWEANPYFAMPPLERMYLTRARMMVRRRFCLYECAGDFLQDLLSPPGGPDTLAP